MGKMGRGKVVHLSQIVPFFSDFPPLPPNFTHVLYISHNAFWAISHNSPFPPIFPHCPPISPFPPNFPHFPPFSCFG